MRANSEGRPARILAVWCPDWPEERPEESTAASAEARAFERVVTVVEAFCPVVEVIRPGWCVLGARGPARYFGGEEALAGQIADAVAAQGHAGHTGVADGQFAACLAARAAAAAGPAAAAAVVVPPGGTRRFLAPYPVHVLGRPVLAGQLIRLGLRTLGDFAALPARDVASRFGSEGSAAQRIARGAETRRLAVGAAQADLSASSEFDPPALAEPVVFAAKNLADQLLAGLAARGLSCVRIRVEVTAGDGHESARLWRHDGLLSALAIAQRVRWQLDGWQTGQDGEGRESDGTARADGGITRLRLVPDQLVRDEGRQLALWGDDLVRDRVERAAMRLQAMLGHELVAHPVLAGGRGPGDRVVLVPFGDLREARLAADRPWPGRIPPPAPATVYPAPRPAQVVDASGAPVTVTGRAVVSATPDALTTESGPWRAITAWAGPWPVTERWWDERQVTRRARFQLVTGDGIGWLAAVEQGRWQIEARYD
ncbi:MAG TPA: DNA polymerase Y family protein [Streptosporangiaceae bacterium]